MYAIDWFASIEEYFGIPWTLHVTSMAISIDSHTNDEKIGTVQYERNHMFAVVYSSRALEGWWLNGMIDALAMLLRKRRVRLT